MPVLRRGLFGAFLLLLAFQASGIQAPLICRLAGAPPPARACCCRRTPGSECPMCARARQLSFRACACGCPGQESAVSPASDLVAILPPPVAPIGEERSGGAPAALTASAVEGVSLPPAPPPRPASEPSSGPTSSGGARSRVTSRAC